jgi:RNA polymerase sigma-70 factor (ECF subfamily)
MELRREIEALHPACFGWAMCCCRFRRQDAEDVLQTAYLKVLEGRARFDGRSSLRTWLFGVIRQTANAQRYQQWVRDELLERWIRHEPGATPQEDLEQRLCTTERSRVLLDAVKRLPRRQREVLHLVFYQDLTVEESAQALGISLGSARTHFDRGKRKLRDLLARTGCDERRP